MEKDEKLAAGMAMAKAICRQKASEKVAIGIDMGTSTCTVGLYQNGQVEIILNEGDSDIGPTFYAASEEDDKKLQELAESEKVHSCPRSTVCDLMKMAGRGLYDNETSIDMKMLPFKISKVGGQAALEAMCRKAERRFISVEISSKILQKVREITECFLGKPVNIAVITVPVYFNEYERQATKDAAANAGFSVLRLMNEPVAAAVAYGFPQQDGRKYALMFDLGGGTLDVSVFSIANGVFDLRATSGNTHLGGKDFDAALVSHVAQEIKSEHGVELTEDKTAMEKLRVLCEQAKRCLSKYETAVIRLDHDGSTYKSTISRTKFEELNADLFNSTLESVEDALDDANVPKECINQIVLVGGSTKIPKIQSLLKEFFNGQELTQTEKPEEAVAFGAAIEAAIVAKEETEKSKEVVYDTAPFSIGIKTAGGLMAVFVPKNTELPCSFTQYISTYKDNQLTALIQIYEGEKRMARNNYHLADLELDLPIAPRGVPKIEVTFCVDKSGIIIVTAEELTTGVKNAILITANYDRLSRAGTEGTVTGSEGMVTGSEGMVTGSQSKQLTDKENRPPVQVGNGLESYTAALLECELGIEDDHCKTVLKRVKEILKWLEKNPTGESEIVECHEECRLRTCENPLPLMPTCVPDTTGEQVCTVDEAAMMPTVQCTPAVGQVCTVDGGGVLPGPGGQVCTVDGAVPFPVFQCFSATTKKL